MKKHDLTKGKLQDQWEVNGELCDEVFKRHLLGDACFGQMCLPVIIKPLKEVFAKTKKEAEQKLAGTITVSVDSIKTRTEQISKCKSCKDFDQCFKLTLVEVIRNATKT